METGEDADRQEVHVEVEATERVRKGRKENSKKIDIRERIGWSSHNI